ncbi:ComE operon protein 1 [Novipirellula aureliae]|uniref:ComE operon protein 1 n=2 Tax=Novipirellula aureliae TaxID=2527966 RepID=A0A5C6ECS9_9BACT|nr:ComE operon protein 1 [Novipirellula aureliae]
MADFSQAHRDASPLAQSRVQWTLVTGISLAFVILSFALITLPTNAPRVSFPSMTSRSIVLDLNIAKSHELALLPSIGPILAERIVEDREHHGRFDSVDDLKRVPGIGPKKLVAIADYCRVTPIDRIALSRH